MCVYIFIYMCIYMCVYIFIYMCIYTNIYIYLVIYMLCGQRLQLSPSVPLGSSQDHDAVGSEKHQNSRQVLVPQELPVPVV